MNYITVITTIYNTSAEYLEKYFISLLNQTFHDFSVIIIDDGSNHLDTIKIIDSFVSEFSGIFSLIRLKENRGISFCRNLALEKVQSSYFCIIDSDDWVDEDFLEKLYNEALVDDVDMVISGYKLCDQYGSICSSEPKDFRSLEETYYQVAGSLASRLIKTSVIKLNELKYPESNEKCLIEDLPFNVFLYYYCNKVCVLRERGYNIRIHEQSTSHDSFRYSRLNLDNTPIEYMEKELKKIVFDFSKERDRIIIGNIIFILSSICCLWTRNSGKNVIKNASMSVGRLIRDFCPHYFRCSICYFRECKSLIIVWPVVYCFSLIFGLEKVSALFIAFLCRKCRD